MVLSKKALERKRTEILGKEGYLVFHNFQNLYPELEQRLGCITGENCTNCTGENFCTAVYEELNKMGYVVKQHTKDSCRETYEKHLKNIVKLTKGKVPVIECVLDLNGYFMDSAAGVEEFRMSNPWKVDIPVDGTYDSKKDLRKIGLLNDDEKMEKLKEVMPDLVGMQPIIDVTDDLGQTVSNYRNFADVKSGKRRIYAIKAPRIDKWERDEKGFVALSPNGYPKINSEHPMMRFYSMLCANYRDKATGENFDLRFTGDHEVLDIVEALTNPESGHFIQEPVDRESEAYRSWKTAIEFPKPYHGVNSRELSELRKKLKVPDSKSLFFITAEPGKAEKTINLFVETYNRLIEQGIFWVNPFRDNEKDMAYARKMIGDVLELVEDTTHDLVPHSVIGSLLKNHEDKAAYLMLLSEVWKDHPPYVKSYLMDLESRGVPVKVLEVAIANASMQVMKSGSIIPMYIVGDNQEGIDTMLSMFNAVTTGGLLTEDLKKGPDAFPKDPMSLDSEQCIVKETVEPVAIDPVEEAIRQKKSK
jgi:hypothetical protein